MVMITVFMIMISSTFPTQNANEKCFQSRKDNNDDSEGLKKIIVSEKCFMLVATARLLSYVVVFQCTIEWGSEFFRILESDKIFIVEKKFYLMIVGSVHV